jgi:hypothetical protein
MRVNVDVMFEFKKEKKKKRKEEKKKKIKRCSFAHLK